MKNSLATEVQLLSDVAKAFAESLDLEETLTSILKSLDTHLKLQRGTISLLDPDSETINIKVAHGLSERSKSQGRYKVGEGVTGRVVQTGEAIIVPDIAKDPRFLHRTKSRDTTGGKKIAFFCVPIRLENRTVGTLSVDQQTGRSDDFDARLRLLNIISTMVAQAIKLNKLVESERATLRDENVRLRRELKTRFDVHNMVGKSNAMQEVYRLIEQVADSNATVLIRGETGTGKDLVAHAIHYYSLRSDKPFVKVNCTALPETLLESELFGHEKGAFTGAIERKLGRFERAHGGTIFLDEIGDFPPSLQVKLLRVVQFREFERVGGTETIQANVRVLVATHKNLEEQIKNGAFPRGFVLPHQRLSDLSAAAAGAQGRHHAAGGPLPGEVRPGERQADHADLHAGDRDAHALSLARQHPGAGELHRAGGPAVRGRRDSQRAAPAVAADGRQGRHGRQAVVHGDHRQQGERADRRCPQEVRRPAAESRPGTRHHGTHPWLQDS